MRINASRIVKTVVTSAVATSALVIPTANSATAATPSSHASGVAVNSIDATCKHHSRNYIVRNYYRGPARYTLRCGTKTWGWKHIKAGHGWNATMDKYISAAIWSGAPNGRGGYSTYTRSCPSYEKFRTIIGTPAGNTDLLTAYRVTRFAAAKC
ncbi:hypothetical protein GCM10012285_19350 [Streptomyces kronopolitis]|uniref:Secreted protein n=1 Tax=Streptomyces kronopolitis TaxID=1612435 RepID=A0ABQ2J873_9ACTN|nr:hypothetical protein [Streptomyces kronopolitis]GGN40810.1 hypothetical protein GCM10012285_19350 [Streptomyces kronopolitis]